MKFVPAVCVLALAVASTVSFGADEKGGKASAAFTKADADKNGMVDQKEAQAAIKGIDFSSADADHNGSLSQREFEAAVNKSHAGGSAAKGGSMQKTPASNKNTPQAPK